MNAEPTRRGFLRTALGAAGALGLAAAGFFGRGALFLGTTIGIPVKPFRRERLRDPHDLAG